MRRKQVWRYYCDHCNKGGCSGGHMKNHEKHCTKNPERVCRMCSATDGSQEPMADLLAALDEGGLDGLRDKAESCAACMLAAILQSGGGKNGEYLDFNYKSEKDALWKEHNDAQMEQEWNAEHYR